LRIGCACFEGKRAINDYCRLTFNACLNSLNYQLAGGGLQALPFSQIKWQAAWPAKQIGPQGKHPEAIEMAMHVRLDARQLSWQSEQPSPASAAGGTVGGNEVTARAGARSISISRCLSGSVRENCVVSGEGDLERAATNGDIVRINSVTPRHTLNGLSFMLNLLRKDNRLHFRNLWHGLITTIR